MIEFFMLKLIRIWCSKNLDQWDDFVIWDKYGKVAIHFERAAR